mmetsp:Transcript_11352/g.29249  ORF Transcript_11352/g.29249 Transcript_11352/m.29249 type:complete len:235 (+) Transcript_11352:533-1237(+)
MIVWHYSVVNAKRVLVNVWAWLFLLKIRSNDSWELIVDEVLHLDVSVDGEALGLLEEGQDLLLPHVALHVGLQGGDSLEHHHGLEVPVALADHAGGAHVAREALHRLVGLVEQRVHRHGLLLAFHLALQHAAHLVHWHLGVAPDLVGAAPLRPHGRHAWRRRQGKAGSVLSNSRKHRCRCRRRRRRRGDGAAAEVRAGGHVGGAAWAPHHSATRPRHARRRRVRREVRRRHCDS